MVISLELHFSLFNLIVSEHFPAIYLHTCFTSHAFHHNPFGKALTDNVVNSKEHRNTLGALSRQGGPCTQMSPVLLGSVYGQACSLK